VQKNLAKIRAIRKEIEGLPGDQKTDAVEEHIFTQRKEKAWSEAEPDFPKPIGKPLGRKWRGHAMLTLLFVSLAIQHYPMQVNAVHVSSPNGLLQAQKIRLPNDKLTLPR